MKGLSFLVKDEFFAVDVSLVQKVAREMTVTQVPSAPDEIIGLTNLKGRVITVLSLSRLLGNRGKTGEKPGATVKVVVFKPLSNNEEQIGLFIDKPGELIDINDELIRPPSFPTGAEESFCISGIAEIENRLYRIVNIDSIIKKYICNGGVENEGNI